MHKVWYDSSKRKHGFHHPLFYENKQHVYGSHLVTPLGVYVHFDENIEGHCIGAEAWASLESMEQPFCLCNHFCWCIPINQRVIDLHCWLALCILHCPAHKNKHEDTKWQQNESSKEIRIVLLRSFSFLSGSWKCEAASIVFAMNELAKLVHQKIKMSL